MTKARCKFRVSSVTRQVGASADCDSETVKLHALYDPDDPEDTKFSRATPSGNLEFQLSNPNLLGTFRPGATYYLDLSPVHGDA